MRRLSASPWSPQCRGYQIRSCPAGCLWCCRSQTPRRRAGSLQGACREPCQLVVFRRPFRDDNLPGFHGILPCDFCCFPFLHIKCFHAVVGKVARSRFDLTQLVLALRQLLAYPDIALFVTESIFLISTEEAGAFVAFSVVRFPSCISTSFASLSCI